MPFTTYRVDADFINQQGAILGPGYITFSYDEAVEKAIDWRENRKDLTNVKISISHYG